MRLLPTYILAACCLLLQATPIFAQNTYEAAAIADSLKKDAYAVVREQSSEFIQTSPTQGKYKVKEVITILSDKGDDYANFNGNYDKFRELESFSGLVYDAAGKVVKKIKKGDLSISTISFGAFATDDYSVYYECKHPTYPYTVEYTYNEKWKDGLLSYPPFFPQGGSHLAVEKGEYRIQVTDWNNLRTKSEYRDKIVRTVDPVNPNTITYSVQNMRAIPSEVDTPPSLKLYPFVMMAQGEFCYDSFCGNMSDWKNYGLWVNQLLKGRDALPADAVAKFQALVKDAKTEREKVQILYNYLQKNTRYVNIAMGIGGYRPMEASAVYKNGFGDCKALSNFMMAMLKAVDIPADYIVISTKVADLFKDYPNFNQLNHAILMVPLKGDSIWLECTSQTIPFGFAHDGIAGHDALVISDQGGKIVKVPEFKNEQRVTETKLLIDIKENGNASGTMHIVEHLDDAYSVSQVFESKDREQIIRYVNASMDMPKIQLGEFDTQYNKTSTPTLVFDAKFDAAGFANITGTRMFLPACPLKKASVNKYSSANRQLDIDIEEGFVQSDTIIFTIPESFSVETLPKDLNLKTDFGFLQIQTKSDGNTIRYHQYMLINSGCFKQSQYADIKRFYSQIVNATKRKIVIKKNN